MTHWKEYRASLVAGVLSVLQIVLSFFYNDAGLDAFRYLGHTVWIVSAILGWLPIYTFRRKGGVPKSKSYVSTTVLVTSGIYSVIRHPQYLAWLLLNTALILITQHWLIMIIGLASMGLAYIDMRKADQHNIKKFGYQYREYMRTVPGWNLPLGLVRLAQRGGEDKASYT